MRRGERRAVGVLAVVSFAVNVGVFALFLGQLPGVTASSPAHMAAWITDHRGRVLVGGVLLAIGWAASVGFLAGLRRLLREERLAADVGLASALVLFAVVAVGGVAVQAAALLAGTSGGLRPETAQLLVAVLVVAFAVSAAPTLLLAAAYAMAIRRTGALPRWAAYGLVVVGVVHVGALLAVAQHGALAPNGVFAVAAPTLYELWQLSVGVALLRSTRATVA